MSSAKNQIGLKTLSLALCAAFLLCMNPVTANATNTSVTVPSTGSSDQNVTATFTIDSNILVDLGYGAVASVPVTIPLTYKVSAKSFNGGESVYCSGIIPDGKKVTVSVDDTDAGYGKITDSASNEYSVKDNAGFSVTLTKAEWSQSEMSDNLAKIQDGNQSEMATGYLFVMIPGKGFVPKVTGDFESVVPLVIKQVDAD